MPGISVKKEPDPKSLSLADREKALKASKKERAEVSWEKNLNELNEELRKKPNRKHFLTILLKVKTGQVDEDNEESEDDGPHAPVYKPLSSAQMRLNSTHRDLLDVIIKKVIHGNPNILDSTNDFVKATLVNIISIGIRCKTDIQMISEDIEECAAHLATLWDYELISADWSGKQEDVPQWFCIEKNDAGEPYITYLLDDGSGVSNCDLPDEFVEKGTEWYVHNGISFAGASLRLGNNAWENHAIQKVYKEQGVAIEPLPETFKKRKPGRQSRATSVPLSRRGSMKNSPANSDDEDENAGGRRRPRSISPA
jgi:hypothetical protein